MDPQETRGSQVVESGSGHVRCTGGVSSGSLAIESSVRQQAGRVMNAHEVMTNGAAAGVLLGRECSFL